MPTSVATKVKLDLLKPHPRQAILFPDLTAEQLEELANDMAARGLQHPIEILPDYTILGGHQRVLAAKILEWPEIDVIIRHDLTGKGELAIEEYLIADNLFRRQMGRLERARCAYRLVELAKGGSLNAMSEYEHGKTLQEIRRYVGRLLGIGEREVVRLTEVMNVPTVVQSCYDSGALGISDVNRVARSREETKAAVAEDIRNGIPPKEAVLRCGKRRPPRQVMNAGDQAYKALLLAIDAAVEQLGVEPETIEHPPGAVYKRVKTLNRGIRLLERLQVCEAQLPARRKAGRLPISAMAAML